MVSNDKETTIRQHFIAEIMQNLERKSIKIPLIWKDLGVCMRLEMRGAAPEGFMPDLGSYVLQVINLRNKAS
jgi:hypothetical protein